jgi:hypothetical protein
VAGSPVPDRCTLDSARVVKFAAVSGGGHGSLRPMAVTRHPAARPRYPAGVTLARLAGDDLAEYQNDADACLSMFAVQAEEHGVRFGFARTAAHGGLACSHWWGHPHWPAQVDQFMRVLSDPADDHWGPGGEYRANLPAEPAGVADRVRCAGFCYRVPGS